MSHHYGTVRRPDRLTARVLDSATRGSGARLDAYRDGDTFYIDIDLPGVDPADIDVTADHHVLTVRCARRRPGRAGPAGPASRQIPLPATLDTDHLDARYDDGVLTLRIPVADPGPDLAAAA
jgi:HSP20 family protein